ncbi:MAG: hypothetical protein PHX78_01815 [bacterium]|nr:hypothetical protein [bacterium]
MAYSRISECLDILKIIQKQEYLDLNKSIVLIEKYLNNKLTINSIAEIIVQLYSDLKIAFSELEIGTNPCEIKIGENAGTFDARYYSDMGLQNILLIKKYAEDETKNDLIDFIIHGSYSTLDYAPAFSDIDLLAVIKDEVIKDPVKLLSLRKKMAVITKYIYYSDPFQHHGIAVISEFDLNYYAQPYFPFIIYKYSKSLFSGNRNTLKIKERPSYNERLESFYGITEYLTKCRIEKVSKGLYDFKSYLSALMLIPCSYLQLKEDYTYKKYSFDKLKNEIPCDLWEVIDKASLIREKWPNIIENKKWLKPIEKLNSNPFLFQMFYCKLNGRIPPYLMNILNDNYLEKVKILIDFILQKARKEGYIPNG